MLQIYFVVLVFCVRRNSWPSMARLVGQLVAVLYHNNQVTTSLPCFGEQKLCKSLCSVTSLVVGIVASCTATHWHTQLNSESSIYQASATSTQSS